MIKLYQSIINDQRKIIDEIIKKLNEKNQK